MKFAYFGIPHIGGTYTVYRSLREGLIQHGITVKWLGLGPKAQAVMNDPAWTHEHAYGLALATDTTDESAQGKALVEHLEAAGYEGVFVNVLASRVQTNVVRYLKPEILRIMIAHNITPGTYAAARAIRDHVHTAVGVSPRIRYDLVKQLGFSPKCTHAIPNAVDLATVSKHTKVINNGPLKLIALGRAENAAKGIFWLPRIMDELRNTEVTLSIAGDGPDLAELKRRCIHLGSRVNFLGRIQPAAVSEVLTRHDVLLFPSRYEGLPLTLVEAMAAGCVPVASRISGVTDFVISDGQDGLLYPVGNNKAAARAVRQLADDRQLLNRMSDAARQNVNDRFSIDNMAAAYADLIKSMKHSTPILANSYTFDNWNYPSGLKPGFRTYLPEGLKNILRTFRERLTA